ncbi:MAG: AzlC family ABC transporter permease [Candidatus Rokubacteria bacterium]|nr:AzlC family ABC transporter permease [Candidatus Rokubacteria bacterium]
MPRGPARLFREGIRGSFPLVPSVFVYATVWGGLARQAGLSLGEIALMCLVVTAGASQFVAVPMIAAGAPPLAVIVTTYVVNMRHYLMAATLAPAFRGFPRGWLALVAHGVNDESFALTTARRDPAGPWFFIGSVVAVYGSFIVGALVGAVVGGLVRDPSRYGLDFAFPAVFLALVAVQLRGRGDWVVAGGAGLLALGIAWHLPGNWHIVIAGLAASGVGALVMRPESP